MERIIILLATASAVSSTVQGILTTIPESIRIHKGKVTWDEAREQCEREGKVIASPINAKALKAMKYVIGNYNITYYIGTQATVLPGEYVSAEGVALEDMPPAVTLDMVHELDQWEGDCLAMSRDSIFSVPCQNRLPYMCYSTEVYNMNKTYCGPEEEGYKYHMAAGHCYKFHKEELPWDQALRVCMAEGGFLVIIENSEQAHIIKHMYNWTHHEYMYIGFHRLLNKYGYFSIHGQPVEQLYDDWLGSVLRTDSANPCGALHKSGKWQNVDCGANLHFVCQKEPARNVC